MKFVWNLEIGFGKMVGSLTSNKRLYEYVYTSECNPYFKVLICAVVLVSTTISHKICVFALMGINYKQWFLWNFWLKLFLFGLNAILIPYFQNR